MNTGGARGRQVTETGVRTQRAVISSFGGTLGTTGSHEFLSDMTDVRTAQSGELTRLTRAMGQAV